MPAIAEEAKRATKMEVGDLALEVIGKTIRIYEITGGSKLKQLAYSDTLQGDRFLMFSAPSNEITRAKDFTIARLYKKPERARKIIARYFPKYASAGASVHLYYAGAGPRGRSGATGEGYFSVPLGGPLESQEGRFNTLWNRQQAMLDEVKKPRVGQIVQGLYKPHVGIKRFDGLVKSVGKYGMDLQTGSTPLTVLFRDVKRMKISDVRGAAIPRSSQESIEEAEVTLRTGTPEEVTLTIEGNKVTAIKERGKKVPVSDEALHRIRSLHGRVAGGLGTKDRKVWQAIKWPPNFGDMRPGQPFEHKGKHYVKLFKGVRKSEVLSVATGQVINLGLSSYDLVRPIKRVTLGENYWRLIGLGFKHLMEAKFDPAKYVGPKYKVGDRVQIVRRFGWKKGYKPVPIKPPVPGKVKQVDRNVFYPKGPPALTLEIDPEDYERASPKVMPTKYHRIRVHSDEVEPLKESAMTERFDPQAAQDYVKAIKDRKAKAYAREYLKAIQGIRQPPTPQEFRITTQMAREVEQGFKKLGAPLAASVERTDPTFEQVARIIRKAKGAGFTPKRVTLTEVKLRGKPKVDKMFTLTIDVDPLKGSALLAKLQRDPAIAYAFPVTPKGGYPGGKPSRIAVSIGVKTPEIARRVLRDTLKKLGEPLEEAAIQIDNYDFIFLIHHDEEDTYQVAHSVHDDPRLGYQELETGLPKKAAERMVHKLKSRWTRAKVRRFLVIGKGHKREFLPESNEEKNKRIKDTVDGEVQDPKNKGLTLMQVLRAMFKGVDEETRQEARKFVDRMAQKHYAKQHYTKAEKARLKKINLRFRGEQVSIDAISLLHTPSGESLDEVSSRTKVLNYVSRIKNKAKKAYAEAYLTWLTGGQTGRQPQGRDFKLGAMGAQAVRMNFAEFGFKESTEEARAKVFVRKLKDAVNYRRAEEERPDERCANCAFVQLPDECKRVRGKIKLDDLCDLFKRGVSEARVRFMCMNCRRAFRTQNGVLARGGRIECPYCGAANVTLIEDLDEALSKKARSVFSALEQNPEGISADKLKHYGAAGDVANLPAFLKKFVKKGWVVQKGDLYLPTPAYYRAQGNAPWIPFAKAKALKNAVFSTVNWMRAGKSEVILYDKKGKQVARTHVTAAEMKQLPGLPISWTDLMWIERHGEPSPGVQMRMKEGLDEATLHGRIKALLKGEDVKVTTAMPGDPIKRIKVIVKRVDTVRLRKKLEAKGFRVRTMGRDLSVSENLDEAAAQGKVQAALLNFVKQLPRGSESTLADAAKRQEFRGVHFKRLMAAAKALEKKGLIWYDGFSNIGPSR